MFCTISILTLKSFKSWEIFNSCRLLRPQDLHFDFRSWRNPQNTEIHYYNTNKSLIFLARCAITTIFHFCVVNSTKDMSPELSVTPTDTHWLFSSTSMNISFSIFMLCLISCRTSSLLDDGLAVLQFPSYLLTSSSFRFFCTLMLCRLFFGILFRSCRRQVSLFSSYVSSLF